MFINSTTEIETRLSISLISASSKFYHGHSDLIVKYNVGLKTFLQHGISELVVYKEVKRIVGKPTFSDHFKNIIKR